MEKEKINLRTSNDVEDINELVVLLNLRKELLSDILEFENYIKKILKNQE
jgi:hypothetical protein